MKVLDGILGNEAWTWKELKVFLFLWAYLMSQNYEPLPEWLSMDMETP